MQAMILETLGVGVGYKKQMGIVQFEFEVIRNICRLWENLWTEIAGNTFPHYTFSQGSVATSLWDWKPVESSASSPISLSSSISGDHEDSMWIHKVRLLLCESSLLKEFESHQNYKVCMASLGIELRTWKLGDWWPVTPPEVGRQPGASCQFDHSLLSAANIASHWTNQGSVKMKNEGFSPMRFMNDVS